MIRLRIFPRSLVRIPINSIAPWNGWQRALGTSAAPDISTDITAFKKNKSLTSHNDWACPRCGVLNAITLTHCWNCRSISSHPLAKPPLKIDISSSSEIISSPQRLSKDGTPLLKDVLKHCKEKNDYQYGLDIVHQKLKQARKIPRAVITQMIYLLSKGGHFDRALQLFDSIGKAKNMRISKDVHHFHAILYGLSISKIPHKLNRAKDIFEEMKKAHIQPNRYMYTTLIKIHVQEHKEDAALQLYEDMIEAGISPDIPLYNW